MSHTCAALSTAAGKAGVSVIRISGDDAFSISDKVFRCADGKALSEQPARKAVFGGILRARRCKNRFRISPFASINRAHIREKTQLK